MNIYVTIDVATKDVVACHLTLNKATKFCKTSRIWAYKPPEGLRTVAVPLPDYLVAGIAMPTAVQLTTGKTTEAAVGSLVTYGSAIGRVIEGLGCDACVLQSTDYCESFICVAKGRSDNTPVELVYLSDDFTKEKYMTNEPIELGTKHDSDKLDWSLLPYKELSDVIAALESYPILENKPSVLLARLISTFASNDYSLLVRSAMLTLDMLDSDVSKRVASLEQVVKVLNFGAKKYAPYNWQKLQRSRIESAAFRHSVAITNGEELDNETNLPHAAHLLCNLLFLMWHFNNSTTKSSAASEPENSLTVEKSDVVEESKNENLSYIVPLATAEEREYTLDQLVEYNGKVGKVTKADVCTDCLLHWTSGCYKFICVGRLDGFSTQLVEVKNDTHI